MALTTYAELKTSIGDWLNRADLTAVIADFISLCEADLNRKIRTRGNFTKASITIAAEYNALPSDFAFHDNLFLTSTSPPTEVLFRDMKNINAERMYRNGGTGQPQYFSIAGSNYIVSPAPDSNYTAELSYYAKIAALSTGTNWLLTKHPDLYLYGSLLQAAPYLKDDDRIQVWQNKYFQILESVNLEEERANYSGSSMTAISQTIG